MSDKLSLVIDENEDGSDDERAEELQLQEVLVASLRMFHLHMSSNISESSQSFCEICMETKGKNEMFKLESCSQHSFCSDCIVLHVESKIQEKNFPVTCPGLRCRAIIEPDSCKSIIPDHAFARWEGGLSESSLLACEEFYCPYNDCSERLIYDRNEEIVEGICPMCQRLLCAQCGVPWHSGLHCDMFQKQVKNREEDLKVEVLAKELKWMECPHCNNMVEKTDGCIHITCRCKLEFCYVCGGIWSEEHWACQISE